MQKKNSNKKKGLREIKKKKKKRRRKPGADGLRVNTCANTNITDIKDTPRQKKRSKALCSCAEASCKYTFLPASMYPSVFDCVSCCAVAPNRRCCAARVVYNACNQSSATLNKPFNPEV